LHCGASIFRRILAAANDYRKQTAAKKHNALLRPVIIAFVDAALAPGAVLRGANS
jgi:hypothetical protein